MMAWIESSGLISADHPPFGLSPNRGAAAIWVMRNGGKPAGRDDGMVSPEWPLSRIGGFAASNMTVNWRAGLGCIRSHTLAHKAAIRHSVTGDDASSA